MHYGNGREAKNGDKVVFLGWGGPTVGILYDAVAGNDYCNGKIAPAKPTDPCPNLKECLHVDDVLALFPAQEGVLADTHPDFIKRVALVPNGDSEKFGSGNYASGSAKNLAQES